MDKSAYISPSFEMVVEIIESEVLDSSPQPGQLEGVVYEDWDFLIDGN